MNYKLVFGIISIIPAVIAYYSYFKQMFAGRTKPHAFSWLIWGLLAANGYLAQASSHAGIGAWVTGLTSIACFTVFGFAWYLGTTDATRLDKVLLAVALTSLALLLVVDDKRISLCLTLLALIPGYVMTINKAYKKPHEENALAFFLNCIKFIPAIPALSSYSFLTVAYPLVNTLGNAAVATVVVLRAKALSRPKHATASQV